VRSYIDFPYYASFGSTNINEKKLLRIFALGPESGGHPEPEKQINFINRLEKCLIGFKAGIYNRIKLKNSHLECTHNLTQSHYFSNGFKPTSPSE
jgi:hypothetical protein